MRVVALAGGTGSAKLLRGLREELTDFAVIANPGDNVWMYGVYVCPDIDIATYTLADVVDTEKGWGIRGDTFNMVSELERLGAETWFKLGDKDFATCMIRTQRLGSGDTLTRATDYLCKMFRVRQKILPPTNDGLETHILTINGEMHLQEYWVKRRALPRVKGVRYVGADKAGLTPEAERAVDIADIIVVCPGNPITSISPILSVRAFRRILRDSKAKKTCLSPMIGRGAFSGPAGTLMRAVGAQPTSFGVAKLYSDFLDEILIDTSDLDQAADIESLGITCGHTNTMMKTRGDELRLARTLTGK